MEPLYRLKETINVSNALLPIVVTEPHFVVGRIEALFEKFRLHIVSIAACTSQLPSSLLETTLSLSGVTLRSADADIVIAKTIATVAAAFLYGIFETHTVRGSDWCSTRANAVLY